MIDVALARCKSLPEPDPDETPLLGALCARGLRAESWAWDDDDVDWSAARMVAVRATWNYYLHREAFLEWAGRVDSVTALHNPLSLIGWNTHKRYLLELDARGVAVVPTELVERGGRVDLAALCARRGWDHIVIKPAVAAASFGAFVARPGDDPERFTAMVAERDVLVQPFVDSVRDHGERSIILIDGEITHSVRKAPRFGGDAESVTGPHPVAPDAAELARAAVAAVPWDEPLLYARVDVVRDGDGVPLVAELELTEPSLFFAFSDEALARMVAGIERRLAA